MSQINFEAVIGAYVKLRDIIKAENDKHTERMKPLNEKLDKLNEILLSNLNATGQDNAKTAAGTAYITMEVSATIADKDAFKRHVIGSQNFDLIDWKANKTAVEAIVDEAGEPPPGVNFARRRKVGVRRPSPN